MGQKLNERASEQGAEAVGQSQPAPMVLAMDGWGSTRAPAAYAPNGASGTNGHAPPAEPIPAPIPELPRAQARAPAPAGPELMRMVQRAAPVLLTGVLTGALAIGALLSWRESPRTRDRLASLSQLPISLAGQKRAVEAAAPDPRSFDELRRRLAELIAPEPEPPPPPQPFYRRWIDSLNGR